jgi:hypothetical protein
MPRATLTELASAPDIAPSASHQQHRDVGERNLLSVTSEAETGVSALAAPPALGTNFFAASSRSLYPADAAGAVGPHHVVGAFNSGIFVSDRNGNRLSSITLAQFWSDPSIFSGLYYDPRIIYDKSADRWFLAALYDNNFKNSTLVIGVSATGDPTGLWSRYRIAVGSDVADFTCLGMSADRFIISANSSHVGSLFWQMTKAEAYTTLQNVQTAFHLNTDFMPVTITDDSTATAYLVTNDESSGSADLWRLDSGATKPALVGHYFASPWNRLFNTRIAPQLFGANVDIGETTMQSAVGRNGVIWAVHSILSTTSPLHSSIRWWRIPIGSTEAVSATIDDPTGATSYGFPSIAVNRLGGALIGYAVFSGTRFPTAAYSYRDPSGSMSSTGILKEGEGAVPATVEHWGDYTTTMVDPVNDVDFWSVQSYGNDQLWGAWWGEVTIPPAAPARSRAVRH